MPIEVRLTDVMPLVGARHIDYPNEILEETLYELRAGGAALPMVRPRPDSSGEHEIITLDRVRQAAALGDIASIYVMLTSERDRGFLQCIALHDADAIRDPLTPALETIRAALDYVGLRLLWDFGGPKLYDLDARQAVAHDVLRAHRRHEQGRDTKTSQELGLTPDEILETVEQAMVEVGLEVSPSSFAAHLLPLLDAPIPVVVALNEGRITRAQAEKLVRHPDTEMLAVLEEGGAIPSSRKLVARSKRTRGTPTTSSSATKVDCLASLGKARSTAVAFLQYPPALTANEFRKVERIVGELNQLAERYSRG